MSALRAFAAFAEQGSVQAAGAGLNVSHAAISQQIRNLEAHLGVQLLDRAGRSAVLTVEGRRLADALLDGFTTIAERVEELTMQEGVRPLHVATTPQFASNWLVHRLPAFRAKHPEIDIMIDPNPALTDPKPGGIDLCIRYGDGNWPGLEAQELVHTPIAVVAAPELIGDRKVESALDLADLPWLQELGTSEASLWLEENGVAEGATKGGMIHLPGNLLQHAARNAQGVAVSTRIWVEDDLAAGRLVQLFEGAFEKGYHVVSNPATLRPAAKAFRAWVLGQARSER